MSSFTRAIVLALSAPVVVFAIVGGLLGTVMARGEDTSYQHLKIRRCGQPDLEQLCRARQHDGDAGDERLVDS
jgi:hypothetical protein